MDTTSIGEDYAPHTHMDGRSYDDRPPWIANDTSSCAKINPKGEKGKKRNAYNISYIFVGFLVCTGSKSTALSLKTRHRGKMWLFPESRKVFTVHLSLKTRQ